MAVRERSGTVRTQTRAMQRYRQRYRQARLTRPSMLEGVASIFDFAGVFAPRPSAEEPPQSDGEAIASDWRTVGDDLWAAIGASRPVPRSDDEARRAL